MAATANHDTTAPNHDAQHFTRTLPAYLGHSDRLVREGPDLPPTAMAYAEHRPGSTLVVLSDGARITLPANRAVWCV